MSQLRTNSIVPVGGIPAGADGGGIIQVVQVVKRDTFSVSQSRAGYSAVTGLSLNITPHLQKQQTYSTQYSTISQTT